MPLKFKVLDSNLLDWLVSMDFQHYKTVKTKNYKPSGKSHFYLKKSKERFTSREIIKIYSDTAGIKLHRKWLTALEETNQF